jgi:hypothetical protein
LFNVTIIWKEKHFGGSGERFNVRRQKQRRERRRDDPFLMKWKHK